MLALDKSLVSSYPDENAEWNFCPCV